MADCHPYDSDKAWLCEKCCEDWAEIYKTKVQGEEHEWERRLWDKEFKIFLGIIEPEKVNFT